MFTAISVCVSSYTVEFLFVFVMCILELLFMLELSYLFILFVDYIYCTFTLYQLLCLDDIFGLVFINILLLFVFCCHF